MFCLSSARSACFVVVLLLKVQFVALTRMCRRYQELTSQPFLHSAAALLAAGEMEQLQDAISNLISVIDSGVDADGEATGGAGDGARLHATVNDILALIESIHTSCMLS